MRKKNIVEFPNEIKQVTVSNFVKKLFESGWTEKDFYRVAGYSYDVLNWRELVYVLRGEAELTITIRNYIVDSDQAPNLHFNHLVSNACYGKIDLLKEKLALHVSPRQFAYGYVDHQYLEIEIKDFKLMNATVMMYLLKHPEIIPQQWQGKDRIYFLGTITGQPKELSCWFIHYDKASNSWSEDQRNLCHYELGMRHSFERNDAVAIIKTRVRKK